MIAMLLAFYCAIIMPRISRRTKLLHFQNQSEKAFSHFRWKIFGLLVSFTCKSYIPHHSYLLPSIGILSSRGYHYQSQEGSVSGEIPLCVLQKKADRVAEWPVPKRSRSIPTPANRFYTTSESVGRQNTTYLLGNGRRWL